MVNGATVTSDDYTYDDLNRRTRANLEDGSLWKCSYNDRNELTGAGGFSGRIDPVAGEQYGYGFDNIGNRTVAQSGSVGNHVHRQLHGQQPQRITGIVTPGSKDILGLAIATNTVTVNGGWWRNRKRRNAFTGKSPLPTAIVPCGKTSLSSPARQTAADWSFPPTPRRMSMTRMGT